MSQGQATSESSSNRESLGLLRRIGQLFRALFIVILLVVTARVAGPQLETVWTAYETPSDLARMVAGFLVCLWLVIHLFRPPRDPEVAYRTWFYLGIPILPLALLCAKVIW